MRHALRHVGHVTQDVTCINDPDYEWDPYKTQNYYLTCDYFETYPAFCETAVSDDGISAVVACPEYCDDGCS